MYLTKFIINICNQIITFTNSILVLVVTLTFIPALVFGEHEKIKPD